MPIGEDKDEILTQHFELRALATDSTTLDRYLERAREALAVEDRIAATATILNIVAELHTHGIAHRDLGLRCIWMSSPTRVALSGLMACQMPNERSLGEWGAVLRGYAPQAPEDASSGTSGTGKQRDVYALGRLAFEILTGVPPATNPDAGTDNDLPVDIRKLAGWLRRATAVEPAKRFSDAQEMADEFASTVEQSVALGVDQTVIDRHETSDLPYVLWPIIETLLQNPRCHIYLRRDEAGTEFVVKVWLGIRRGMNVRTDVALTRLFDGVSRIRASPIEGLPAYTMAALSPAGPFVTYRHEKGITLDVATADTPLDCERSLKVAERLAHCVDALHAIGCTHGDISPKNIILREEEGEPLLLDLFDIAEVGDGHVRTPSLCPDGWERLTEQQIDRYATIKIILQLLEAAKDDRIAELMCEIRRELERPTIETLEPTLVALRKTVFAVQALESPRFELCIPGASRDYFRSDEGKYYLRASRPRRDVIEYGLAGIDREMIFEVLRGQLATVKTVPATFINLAHASQHGVPISVEIKISDGPDRGFEELFAFLEPLITAPAIRPEEVDSVAPSDAQRALDVRRYWRKLLELEESFEPEVEILNDVGTRGAAPAYKYERVGRDFDFDIDTTVDVRLASGRKVGEVDLGQTDATTLVVQYSERPLLAGDRVKLVDRRARTSFERRTKAVERILDDEAAVKGLIDYFTIDSQLEAVDYGITVAESDLDAYTLNQGQKAAFRHLVRYGPLGLLQGPPGTGKTHFIAALVHWLIARVGARKVLIASQSHESVNNVIEALINLFRRLGGRPNLLRIGSKGITDKIRPYHTSSLRERYQARFDAAFKHRVLGLGSAAGLKRDFMGDAVNIDRQLGDRVARLQMLAVADHDQENLPMEERRRRDAAVRTAVRAFVAAGRNLLGRDPNPAHPQQELNAAYNALLQKHPGSSPADVAKARHLIELSREWSASLASSHRNFEEFLAKTRTIVTATCVGVGQTRIRIDATNYDWVIVDEAGRCTPGELAVPIQIGRRVLMVGDHLQLLPMIDRHVLNALRNEMPDIPVAELVRSDFERAYLSNYGKKNGHILTEQYRMAPAISDLVSKVFYEPNAVRLETSKERKPSPLFAKSWPAPFAFPITWIDTSTEPRHVEQSAEWNKTSFWNAAEAEAVLKILERVSENADLVAGLAEEPDETPIGVICMYSAQKVKIEQAFSQRPWEARFRRLVRIDTVDSYQGKENTIVITSLVRCNGKRDQGHVRSPNRCNVALSRAKERVFVVGARSMWSALSQRYPMRRVLDYIDADTRRATTVKAGQL